MIKVRVTFTDDAFEESLTSAATAAVVTTSNTPVHANRVPTWWWGRRGWTTRTPTAQTPLQGRN